MLFPLEKPITDMFYLTIYKQYRYNQLLSYNINSFMSIHSLLIININE